MPASKLQRSVISAVERVLSDGRKAVQVDEIIENLVAEHGESNRQEITELVVKTGRTVGLAVFWTAAKKL